MLAIDIRVVDTEDGAYRVGVYETNGELDPALSMDVSTEDVADVRVAVELRRVTRTSDGLSENML
jgi:hypothetical protein